MAYSLLWWSFGSLPGALFGAVAFERGLTEEEIGALDVDENAWGRA